MTKPKKGKRRKPEPRPFTVHVDEESHSVVMDGDLLLDQRTRAVLLGLMANEGMTAKQAFNHVLLTGIREMKRRGEIESPPGAGKQRA